MIMKNYSNSSIFWQSQEDEEDQKRAGIMTDESIMPFGKHKGVKLANVPADYLLFLHKEGFCRGELKEST